MHISKLNLASDFRECRVTALGGPRGKPCIIHYLDTKKRHINHFYHLTYIQRKQVQALSI